MTQIRKTHARSVGTDASVCGTEGRKLQLADTPDAVTCGRCRQLLGMEPYAVLLPAQYRALKGGSPVAVNSLLERAFVQNEARIDELCKLGRGALQYWDGATDEADIAGAGDNLADVVRGFISALGRAD